MKKLFIIPLLAFSLGGCAGGNVPFPNTNVSDVLTKIQAFAVQSCKFEPKLASVGAIVSVLFPAGIPVVGGAEVVAHAICSAPVLSGARRGGAIRRSVQLPDGRRVIVSGVVR